MKYKYLVVFSGDVEGNAVVQVDRKVVPESFQEFEREVKKMAEKEKDIKINEFYITNFVKF